MLQQLIYQSWDRCERAGQQVTPRVGRWRFMWRLVEAPSGAASLLLRQFALLRMFCYRQPSRDRDVDEGVFGIYDPFPNLLCSVQRKLQFIARSRSMDELIFYTGKREICSLPRSPLQIVAQSRNPSCYIWSGIHRRLRMNRSVPQITKSSPLRQRIASRDG